MRSRSLWNSVRTSQGASYRSLPLQSAEKVASLRKMYRSACSRLSLRVKIHHPFALVYINYSIKKPKTLFYKSCIAKKSPYFTKTVVFLAKNTLDMEAGTVLHTERSKKKNAGDAGAFSGFFDELRFAFGAFDLDLTLAPGYADTQFAVGAFVVGMGMVLAAGQKAGKAAAHGAPQLHKLLVFLVCVLHTDC